MVEMELGPFQAAPSGRPADEEDVGDMGWDDEMADETADRESGESDDKVDPNEPDRGLVLTRAAG